MSGPGSAAGLLARHISRGSAHFQQRVPVQATRRQVLKPVQRLLHFRQLVLRVGQLGFQLLLDRLDVSQPGGEGRRGGGRCITFRVPERGFLTLQRKDTRAPRLLPQGPKEPGQVPAGRGRPTSPIFVLERERPPS